MERGSVGDGKGDALVKGKANKIMEAGDVANIKVSDHFIRRVRDQNGPQQD